MKNIQDEINNLLNSEIGRVNDRHISLISKRKIIYQFDMDNNIVKKYLSVSSWEKEFGLNGNEKNITGLHKCRGFYFSSDPNFIVPEQINRGHAVQLFKDGIVMYEFDSIREAQDFLQVNRSTIKDALQGRQKTCRGYVVKKK